MVFVQNWNPRQHMLAEKYEINHYRDAYLSEVALHHHDFYELYFYISGNISYTVESRNYNLSPGDILLISPQELHQPVIGQSKLYERIVFWINANYLRSLSTQNNDLTRCFNTQRTHKSNLLRVDEQAQSKIRLDLTALMEETESEKPYSALLGEALLIQIMVQINRLYKENTAYNQNAETFTGTMAEIIRFLNENHTSALTLDMLSERFYISKYHMSREFMRHYGITIHRYIIKRRLITAKQKMMDGTPPSIVFMQCGFSDYTNFYRAFRAEYGITPKEFKEYAQTSKQQKTLLYSGSENSAVR